MTSIQFESVCIFVERNVQNKGAVHSDNETTFKHRLVEIFSPFYRHITILLIFFFNLRYVGEAMMSKYTSHFLFQSELSKSFAAISNQSPVGEFPLTAVLCAYIICMAHQTTVRAERVCLPTSFTHLMRLCKSKRITRTFIVYAFFKKKQNSFKGQ